MWNRTEDPRPIQCADPHRKRGGVSIAGFVCRTNRGNTTRRTRHASSLSHSATVSSLPTGGGAVCRVHIDQNVALTLGADPPYLRRSSRHESTPLVTRPVTRVTGRPIPPRRREWHPRAVPGLHSDLRGRQARQAICRCCVTGPHPPQAGDQYPWSLLSPVIVLKVGRPQADETQGTDVLTERE